jgi:hypothetical protein
MAQQNLNLKSLNNATNVTSVNAPTTFSFAVTRPSQSFANTPDTNNQWQKHCFPNPSD